MLPSDIMEELEEITHDAQRVLYEIKNLHAALVQVQGNIRTTGGKPPLPQTIYYLNGTEAKNLAYLVSQMKDQVHKLDLRLEEIHAIVAY